MEKTRVSLNSKKISGTGYDNSKFPKDDEWQQLHGEKKIIISDFTSNPEMRDLHLIFNSKSLSENIHSDCEIEIPENAISFKILLKSSIDHELVNFDISAI